MSTTASILVTGDHGADYNLYLHSTLENPPAGAETNVLSVSPGGAGIIESALAHVTGSSPLDVRLVCAQTEHAAPVAAVWTPHDSDKKSKDQKKPKVWRIKQSIGLGNLEGQALLPLPALPKTHLVPTKKEDYAADILVIEDNGSGFRFNPPSALKDYLNSAAEALPRLVILKTSTPICHGPLWWHLTSTSELADRLLVIVSANDLRRAEIQISRGIAWERTAQDLRQAIADNPALVNLRRARHVIVTLQGEGALWVERTSGSEPTFTLSFDAAHMEGEWADSLGINGEVYGYHSVFAAAIAATAALAPNTTPLPAAIGKGIASGLQAMRCLRLEGHGPVGGKPGLPAAKIAEVISGKSAANLGAFACVSVPAPKDRRTLWRILETGGASSATTAAAVPLYGKARRVALLGLRQLNDVPYAIFGRCFTADREEIEALRNLKQLILAYKNEKTASRPLSLAVFGPPGAGKSFGIKQIAGTVLSKDESEFLEFNLSQFSCPADLIGALHQVRDKVLEGKLPVVFWDEFDAKNYQWLQFLLAPMQDGKFQSGELTHPIGRCIFAFAGATSYTLENFGPVKPGPEATAEKRKAYEEFVLKKGPDFISRLHGSLNVLGPNPRQSFNGQEWVDDPSDICFPVRRAILLRAMLGMMDATRGNQRLEIDPGLLAALLEVGHYKYGSRSFEKIVSCVQQGKGPGYNRAALPTDEVLAMNLQEVGEFKALLDEASGLLPHIDLLAAAIHARWSESADITNVFKTEFDNLDGETKGDNIAAACRIPRILGLAGLRLVPAEEAGKEISDVGNLLRDQIEILAEEEHIGWMIERIQNGWKKSERTEDKVLRKQQRANRQHDCLVPYRDLPESERNKDRGSILWYPRLAELAGFKIVVRKR